MGGARACGRDLGVNVSPRQLRRAGFAERAAATVARARPGLAFVLELTESAWSLEASRLLPVLHELRAAGFTLAIDDFGAGYSSLWRLRELPVQVIKVDRAFLDGVPEPIRRPAPSTRRSCSSPTPSAATSWPRAWRPPRRRRSCASRGCGILQGYHFSRPLPAAEAGALLRERLDPRAPP